MTRSLGQDYLETVLGWKALPDFLEWPAANKQSGVEKKLFGVFAPSLSAEEENLLQKMLAAIKITEFEKIPSNKESGDFIHVLSFHQESLPASSAKVWLFHPLADYLHGNPQELSQRKKQAWEMLKRFRQEAFS